MLFILVARHEVCLHATHECRQHILILVMSLKHHNTYSCAGGNSHLICLRAALVCQRNTSLAVSSFKWHVTYLRAAVVSSVAHMCRRHAFLA